MPVQTTLDGTANAATLYRRYRTRHVLSLTPSSLRRQDGVRRYLEARATHAVLQEQAMRDERLGTHGEAAKESA